MILIGRGGWKVESALEHVEVTPGLPGERRVKSLLEVIGKASLPIPFDLLRVISINALGDVAESDVPVTLEHVQVRILFGHHCRIDSVGKVLMELLPVPLVRKRIVLVDAFARGIPYVLIPFEKVDPLIPKAPEGRVDAVVERPAELPPIFDALGGKKMQGIYSPGLISRRVKIYGGEEKRTKMEGNLGIEQG